MYTGAVMFVCMVGVCSGECIGAVVCSSYVCFYSRIQACVYLCIDADRYICIQVCWQDWCSCSCLGCIPRLCMMWWIHVSMYVCMGFTHTSTQLKGLALADTRVHQCAYVCIIYKQIDMRTQVWIRVCMSENVKDILLCLFHQSSKSIHTCIHTYTHTYYILIDTCIHTYVHA
jgi:hypothetical protein